MKEKTILFIVLLSAATKYTHKAHTSTEKNETKNQIKCSLQFTFQNKLSRVATHVINIIKEIKPEKSQRSSHVHITCTQLTHHCEMVEKKTVINKQINAYISL